MQAVPSLVGTGTIVAAAAAGLVFGQPVESTAPRPSSHKRKLTLDVDSPRSPITQSRPSTGIAASPLQDDVYLGSSRHVSESSSGPLSSHPTNTARLQGSIGTQVTPPKTTSRRQSMVRPTDLTAYPVPESWRDSISSNGSWMKRLSIRPLSQHGSPRSSMGPDSPSLTFSHGSGAPMLSPLGATAPPLPPNKLVKRSAAGQNGPPVSLSRKGSRSQMLRRPATSHQRSATLQQVQYSGILPVQSGRLPKYSLDQQERAREAVTQMEIDTPERREMPGGWSSFFHFRVTKSTGRGSSGSPSSVTVPSKRIQHVRTGSMPRAYLTKPAVITGMGPSPEQPYGSGYRDGFGDSPLASAVTPSSMEETPSKRPRRSISMHFSSPSNWIPKSGSIRRPKRGSAALNTTGQRHVSAPITSTNTSMPPPPRPRATEIFPSHEPSEQVMGDVVTTYQPKAQRKRNSSSPLPPLSRLSSFNIDLNRLGQQSTANPGPQRSTHVSSGSSRPSQGQATASSNRATSGDRSSFVAASDRELRDFISGEDDDTDGRSDGMFDSFRTVASARQRNVETPVESMFDESPPGTAGNVRAKRLSIQEILGMSWDSGTKIMEEDEGNSTPMQSSSADVDMAVADADGVEDGDHGLEMASQGLSLAHGDFSRLSLDDDDNDGWARDDENALSNHLSPPSSSLNSRRASPLLRHALVSISGNGSPENRFNDAASERPRSNVFDWSEPSAHDKLDGGGYSPRPRTVHGKQEMDFRGGRPANRSNRPSAAHVRSQSVPVVPDPTDSSKTAPKFGTWGLGTKTASEDWDEDFDFDEFSNPMGGKNPATSFSMVVPASIQATQPTVKAHSGQIRELSLLVNDLKRLCRHGKDLDIIGGSSAPKWREAENIIELASPDEDDEEDEKMEVDDASREFDPSSIDKRFLEEGFDAGSLDRTDDIFARQETEASRSTVLRERQIGRRRSVFSPEDDIFGGNWPLNDEAPPPERPHTPEQPRISKRDSAMISTVMEAMQQQRSTSDPVKRRSPVKPSQSKLFFDTNSLQELVKKASYLRDTLSDVVRRAELLTQSPAGTPRRERVSRLSDGSPAFTRVFTDPASGSPPKRLPQSHSANTVLSRTSIDSPRMQVMAVN